jgi:hypothetical protein
VPRRMFSTFRSGSRVESPAVSAQKKACASRRGAEGGGGSSCRIVCRGMVTGRIVWPMFTDLSERIALSLLVVGLLFGLAYVFQPAVTALSHALVVPIQHVPR